jgi:hypothetical protein
VRVHTSVRWAATAGPWGTLSCPCLRLRMGGSDQHWCCTHACRGCVETLWSELAPVRSNTSQSAYNVSWPG